jgi:hypothetical protein
MNILINPPKKIFVTKEEFEDFTYYDMACFWCNWRVAFHYDECENIVMYTGKEDICQRCLKNHRFSNITWYQQSKSETFFCIIKKDSNLYDFITKKLTYLIME